MIAVGLSAGLALAMGAAPAEAAEAAEAAPRQRTKLRGQAFDTCSAPPLATMRAWRGSLEAVGIYIGGGMRACSQPNLTRSWVKQVRRMGWHLVPLYVGKQARCTKYSKRIKYDRAGRQGRKSASNAIKSARRLGLPRRSPIYYNMEAYDRRKVKCRTGVLRFLNGWTKGLHRRKYISGVYSSASAAIADLAQFRVRHMPDGIWFAQWDKKNTVWGSPYFPDDIWTKRRRIKQYQGPHKERHGGVTLKIDRSRVDGYVV